MEVCCGKPVEMGCPEGGSLLECCENKISYGKWISLSGYVDPPEPPEGFYTEVRRDAMLGIVTHYRHLPYPSVADDEAAHIERIEVEQMLDARAWTDRNHNQSFRLFGHWSKHRLADGVFLPLACYVPSGPDYTTVPLYCLDLEPRA